jgi:hypothetical protein
VKLPCLCASATRAKRCLDQVTQAPAADEDEKPCLLHVASATRDEEQRAALISPVGAAPGLWAFADTGGYQPPEPNATSRSRVRSVRPPPALSTTPRPGREPRRPARSRSRTARIGPSEHEWSPPSLPVEVEPRSGEAVRVLFPRHRAVELHSHSRSDAHVGETDASAIRATASPGAPPHLDEVDLLVAVPSAERALARLGLEHGVVRRAVPAPTGHRVVTVSGGGIRGSHQQDGCCESCSQACQWVHALSVWGDRNCVLYEPNGRATLARCR